MQRVYAERWLKSWDDRLYTFSYYTVENHWLGSHLLIHWRTHTFGFAENSTLSQLYDSDAQIQTVFYYITEVYRLITLAGSLRYLVTLLKYNLFYYIVELNFNKIILLSFTKS